MNCVRNDAPHMAETFSVLLETIRLGDPIPKEIVLPLEDDNSITWNTVALIEAAQNCTNPLSATECKTLGLAEGSCYADAAFKLSKEVQ